MNDPEVTMLDSLPTATLLVHSKALTAAGLAIRLVARVPSAYRSLADQVVRSASSVPANLAEGHGRSGRDRLQHWRIAYGSAKEVDSHLRLLVVAGVIDAESVGTVLELFDEVRGDDVAVAAPRPVRGWRCTPASASASPSPSAPDDSDQRSGSEQRQRVETDRTVCIRAGWSCGPSRRVAQSRKAFLWRSRARERIEVNGGEPAPVE